MTKTNMYTELKTWVKTFLLALTLFFLVRLLRKSHRIYRKLVSYRLALLVGPCSNTANVNSTTLMRNRSSHLSKMQRENAA